MKSILQTRQGPIEYRSLGQGPTMLILNGGHTNCDSPLGHELFFLQEGYQLIIPSRPGYGKTPVRTGRTAEAFADALVDLLDLLHIDQVIVVGISAAGPTALQLAGRYPARIKQVILENAVYDGHFTHRLIRIMSYLFFNSLTEGLIWACFRAYGRRAPQAALKAMMKSLSSLPVEKVLMSMSPDQQQAALALLLASRSGSGFLRDIRHHCGDLSRITAPTLIINSQFDGSVDASHAAYMLKHIPHAEHFLSQAESHLLWFSDHDQEVQAKIHTFLTSIPS